MSRWSSNVWVPVGRSTLPWVHEGAAARPKRAAIGEWYASASAAPHDTYDKKASVDDQADAAVAPANGASRRSQSVDHNASGGAQRLNKKQAGDARKIGDRHRADHRPAQPRVCLEQGG